MKPHTTAIPVLLADDHPVVRDGVRRILEQSDHARVVAETGDGREVLPLALRFRPEVLLLDVSLPGRDGLDVLAEVRRQLPALRVIMLSMHPAAGFAPLARSLGAAGYLGKDVTAVDLVSAVGRVARGGTCFGDAGAQPPPPRAIPLSSQETAVLDGIAKGRPLRQIALDLGIHPKTVTTYRRRLLDKLGLASNAELVAWWMRTRLRP